LCGCNQTKKVGQISAFREKPLPGEKAALGFRAHSGWAVLVVVGGPLESPVVVDRRRIEIADSTMAGSKQPYHAAEGLNLKDAEILVNACTERSTQLATAAVEAAIRDAKRKGYRVSTSGTVAGSGKAVPALEKILASHPLLHTAEGELFRNVIKQACANHHLSVVAVKEKELTSVAQNELGISGELIEQHLQRMGKAIGAPWRQDEKSASLVAWMALAQGWD
jgi:hypothetical protein